jgi:hypothetical protein
LSIVLDEKNYGSSKKFVGENRKMNGVGAWECWNECMGTGKLLPPSKYEAGSWNSEDYLETKKIRNQAYTHLKEAVDYIREYGRYVFWRNPARLKGYRSDYRRMLNKRSTRRKSVPELETGYVPITIQA